MVKYDGCQSKQSADAFQTPHTQIGRVQSGQRLVTERGQIPKTHKFYSKITSTRSTKILCVQLTPRHRPARSILTDCALRLPFPSLLPLPSLHTRRLFAEQRSGRSDAAPLRQRLGALCRLVSAQHRPSERSELRVNPPESGAVGKSRSHVTALHRSREIRVVE